MDENYTNFLHLLLLLDKYIFFPPLYLFIFIHIIGNVDHIVVEIQGAMDSRLHYIKIWMSMPCLYCCLIFYIRILCLVLSNLLFYFILKP